MPGTGIGNFQPQDCTRKDGGIHNEVQQPKPLVLPHRLKGIAPLFPADNHRFLVYRLVREVALVDQHDLMPRLAVVGEYVFQRTKIPEVGDLGVDLLAHLAHNSLLTPLAKLYRASEGAVEGLAL